MKKTKQPKEDSPASVAGFGVERLVLPWDWVKKDQRKALRLAGVDFKDQDEGDYWCHVVAEDVRYPIFCVNGVENFGMEVDLETGEPKGTRFCICASRSESNCICSI